MTKLRISVNFFSSISSSLERKYLLPMSQVSRIVGQDDGSLFSNNDCVFYTNSPGACIESAIPNGNDNIFF
jgi:hypothetical protein